MIKKLILKLKTFLNQRKNVPHNYPFVMRENEKTLFKKNIKDSKYHLEFGTGGSTIFTLLNSNSFIYSIDTSIEWLNHVNKYKIIKRNLNKRLKILYVDIGPTKFWGYPSDDTHKEKFPLFSSKIFNEIDASIIDTILIDGRFRVACALQSILKCENKNVKIMMHDYYLREEYSIVERFLNKIESASDLVVFSIKNDIDLNEVRNLYEFYKYIPE